MNEIKRIDIDRVDFKLKVQDIFNVKNSYIAVCGKINKGKIKPNSKILIIDEAGNVIKESINYSIDWFNKDSNCEYGSEGMDIAILFKDIKSREINIGDYVVI